MKNTVPSDLKSHIIDAIRKRGGWINGHAHFDRAYTISPAILDQGHALMEEKWRLVDPMKRASSEEIYYHRIERAVNVMIRQGVAACATFIDVDPVAEFRAVHAALQVRKKYAGKIRMRLINQVLKGVVDPVARKWAEKAVELVDIIGGNPSKDRPNAVRHLNTVMSWAKETGKMVHVHVDQENNPREHDTELLARKTIEFGLEGKVVAIHAISVGAQPGKKRQELYKIMKAAGLTVVCSPSAALSMRALPYRTEIHNSIVPVPELLEAGIPVALGCDNMGDIFQPLVDGDMYTELRFLAEANRFYDISMLVDIATRHGRKALGI